MTKNPFVKKTTSIRYKYGQKAAEYFEAHPKCEKCTEVRICTLNIHHRHGKSVEEFETLCFNCHMAYHANDGDFSYGDHLNRKETEKKAADTMLQRDLEIIKTWKETNSLRQAGRKLGISYNTVRNAILRQGLK